MLDWDKFLPRINKLMNEFASPDLYPTDEKGLLQ